MQLTQVLRVEKSSIASSLGGKSALFPSSVSELQDDTIGRNLVRHSEWTDLTFSSDQVLLKGPIGSDHLSIG